MRFSVIVVTMGGSPVLERGLTAIAGGTRQPDEIILVDQSLAGLAPPAERWLSDWNVPFQHLAVPRMGVSEARNRGAQVASCEWLVFTDDDCVPDPGWLTALAAAAEHSEADGASSRVLPLEDPTPGLVGVSLRTATQELVFDGSLNHTPWDIGTGASMLISARAFAELGGFDEEFGPGAPYRAAEDIDLLERLMRRGATVVYTPDAVVYHQMKTRRAWLGRQVPYGFGMGAMVARAERGRRRFLARRYVSMQARSVLSGLRRGAVFNVLESILSTLGFVRGLFLTRRRRS